MGDPPFVDSAEFYQLPTRSAVKPVVVSFWLDWVGPCHILRDHLRSADDDFPVDVYRVDGDASPELVSRFDVEYYPTTMLFENGGVTDRLVGDYARGVLYDFLDSNLE